MNRVYIVYLHYSKNDSKHKTQRVETVLDERRQKQTSIDNDSDDRDGDVDCR